MTDRDELADRLDAVDDEIGAEDDTYEHEPLTAEEKRELAVLLDPDAPGDPALGELKRTNRRIGLTDPTKYKHNTRGDTRGRTANPGIRDFGRVDGVIGPSITRR